MTFRRLQGETFTRSGLNPYCHRHPHRHLQDLLSGPSPGLPPGPSPDLPPGPSPGLLLHLLRGKRLGRPLTLHPDLPLHLLRGQRLGMPLALNLLRGQLLLQRPENIRINSIRVPRVPYRPVEELSNIERQEQRRLRALRAQQRDEAPAG